MIDYLAIIESTHKDTFDSFIFKAKNIEAAYNLTENLEGPTTKVWIQSIPSVWLNNNIRRSRYV